MRVGPGRGHPSSDSRPQRWVPTDLDGAVLWLRADADNVVLTSTSVDEWLDMSDSGADFVDQSAKPTWNETDADFNGHPSIAFDGSTQELALATPGTLAGASASHLFWCAHKSATANVSLSHVLFASGTSPYGSPNHIGFFFGFGGGNDLGMLFGGANVSVAGSTQTTTTRVDVWVADGNGNTLEVLENGVSVGTGTYGTDNVLVSGTTATIGCDAGGIRNYSGKIAELGLVNGAVSGDDLAALLGYLTARYL